MITYNITYEEWTPEDIEAGDTDCRGFKAENESIDPDEYDIEDAAELDMDPAVYVLSRYMEREGYTAPSCVPPSGPCWYSWPDAAVEDYSTGAVRMESIHPAGLTDAQWTELHKAMASK